jgi:phage terminase small subunit
MANHPHDADRPESVAVRRALAKRDIEALRLALTPRQRAFAHEYVVDFQGKEAAIRAGYATKWADRQAHINLRHKGIAFLIDHLNQSKAAKVTAVSPEYVLQKVTEIITKDGTKDGDKLRGLELLARHLGMFIDRTEITGKDGEAIQLEQKRATEEEAAKFTLALEQLRERVSDKKDIDLN